MSNSQDPVPDRVDADARATALDQFPVETPTGIAQPPLEPRTDDTERTRPSGRDPQPAPEAIAAWAAAQGAATVESHEFDPQPIVLPRDDHPWSEWQERRRKTQPEPLSEPLTNTGMLAAEPTGAPEQPPDVGEEPALPSAPRGLFGAAADDETGVEHAAARPSAARSLRLVWVAVAVLAAIVIIEGIYIATSRDAGGKSGPVASASNVGTVHVQSTPPGAAVLLNGQDRGVTPATLLMAAGDYQLEIVREGQRQLLPVKVKAGAEAVYQVVLPGATTATGGVRVSSDPAGVPVAIDGARRGSTPLTISDLNPGDHTVTVFGPSGSIQNKVAVSAGGLASVAVTLPGGAKGTTGGPTAVGFLTVEAPVEMQLLEGGKLVGTTRMDRIILPAGQHEIEAVNEALGYSATQKVTIAADRPTRVQFDVPTAKINVNAIPWADVTIDGANVGQTPIGNLSIAIGAHEIVYRHPQLGEQRQTITVTVAGPNRFSTTMRR
jgi:PEGA domain